jgi:flagellar L-ring protein precursor FlgH
MVIPSEVREEPRENKLGSLWQNDGSLSTLFGSLKARRVGDIVTIKVVESSTASNKATTQTGRKSELLGQMQGFFNLEKDYPSTHPFFNPFSKVQGGMESDFDGSGATARSGTVTAFVSAKVTEILPNGNLRIAGQREVRVNNETQHIILTGVVRPTDIAPNNIVLSTYIADAKVTYSGEGVVHNRQYPGWLATALERIWPF